MNLHISGLFQDMFSDTPSRGIKQKEKCLFKCYTTSLIEKQFGGGLQPVKAGTRGSLLYMPDESLEGFLFGFFLLVFFLYKREMGIQVDC